MEELYKQIKNHPKYEISRSGSIRNIKTGYILKPTKYKNKFRITLDGKTEYVARLVAQTYLKNNGKTDIRYVDKNKLNHSVSNLEWASHSDTQKDSYTCGRDAPGGNMPPKRIRVNETGEVYESIRACGRSINCAPSGIRRCLKGEIKSYKGHTFKLL